MKRVTTTILSLILVAGTGAWTSGLGWAEEETSKRLLGLMTFPEQGLYERDGKTYKCGLYPDGKNEMPAAHRKAGEKLAASIPWLRGNR